MQGRCRSAAILLVGGFLILGLLSPVISEVLEYRQEIRAMHGAATNKAKRSLCFRKL
jgi:hypothetical protein